MRKLVLAVVLVLAAGSAQAALSDRDVLVAPTGTIYTVESVLVNELDGKVQSTFMLMLTVQDGDTLSRTIVPASTSWGVHWRPTLAYDQESRTLWMLWLHMPNAMSSELLLAAYRNGRWQPAVSIDDKPYDLRYNLKIGITRRVAKPQPDGTFVDVPALVVHAVWWDETGAGEKARYALISIDEGSVSSIDIHDLSEFVNSDVPAAIVGGDFNRDLLKHPAILDGPTADSIDVVFADAKTDLFHRVTLRPVIEARIHIPVGHSDGDRTPTFQPPADFTSSWEGSVTTISSSRDHDKLLFCSTTEKGVTYLVHSQGGWSAVKTVPTSSTLSPDAAMAALVKMISNE